MIEPVTGGAANFVSVAGENPFVGPRPFEAGRELFGRDSEIADLYYLLSAERIVLLHSPSGAGKSSLIHAGLLPRLAERFDVWGPARVNLKPPAGAPNRFVCSAMAGFDQQLPAARRREPEQLAPLTLAEYAQGRPRKRSAPSNVALIFDQFEEILTIDRVDLEAKREFFRQLGLLLQDPRYWALFSLREDYLAPLDPYAPFIPAHLRNRFRLDLLSREAAREAIGRPAPAAGRVFTTEALDKLVTDLATVKVQQPDGTFVEQAGGYVEPLQLQVVCRGLWERMPPEDTQVDPDDVEVYGNVTNALSAYYAGEVARISGGSAAVERAIREWIGTKLITAGGIRGQVLRGAGSSEGLDNERIARLIDTHLVRAEQRGGAVWFELAHDRLIGPVREDNRRWREANLSGFQKACELWVEQKKSPDLLLRGEALASGREWAAANSPDAREQEFLAESVKAEEARAKEEQRVRDLRKKNLLLRIGAAVMAVAAIVAVGFFLWAKAAERKALEAQSEAGKRAREAEDARGEARSEEKKAKDARKDADKEKEKAEISGQEARRSLAMLHNDRAESGLGFRTYDQAWLYTLSAIRNGDPKDVPEALGRLLLTEVRPAEDWRARRNRDLIDIRSYENSKFDQVVQLGARTLGGGSYGLDWVISRPRDRTTEYLFFSDSGTGVPGEVRALGNSASQQRFLLREAIAGSPSRTLGITEEPVAIRSADGTVVFRSRYAKAVAWMGLHAGVIDEDGTIQFATPNMQMDPRKIVTGITRPVSMAFPARPPFDRVAIADAKGDITLWSAQAGGWSAPGGGRPSPRFTLTATAMGSPARSVLLLTRTGRLLAAGTESGLIFIYEVSMTSPPVLRASFRAHRGPVTALTESPDGAVLVSAGQDGVIRRSYWEVSAVGARFDLAGMLVAPDSEESRSAIEAMLKRSAEALHQRYESAAWRPAEGAGKVVEAGKRYYGRQAVLQLMVSPEGKFRRRDERTWSWEREGQTTALQVRAHDQKLGWSLSAGHYMVLLPENPGTGDWWRMMGLGGQPDLPMGTVTKNQAGDEYSYGRSLFSGQRDASWRVQTRAGNAQWATSYTAPEAVEARRGMAAGGSGALEFAWSSLKFQAPARGGMLSAAGDPSAAWSPIFALTAHDRLPSPARFTWYADAEDFSAFENLSLNEQGNVAEVLPGEPVQLSVLWSAGPNRTNRSCPGCIFQVYLGFYDPVLQQGKSWCLMSRTLPGRVGGLLREEFQAPFNPGVYLLTTYEAPMFGCSDVPANHAFNGMDRAVGAIVVRKRSNLPD